ncbi:hypothetical protein [Actinocorallia longicatena]|uniref:Uncharacterized protein n=1 Tax=Actinocorallia longicatena TaxID=111803 RepID=A0ABP6QKP7_9ACTN
MNEIAYEDQYQAAVSDTLRILGRAATVEDRPVQVDTNAWLHDRFTRNIEHLRAGSARLCSHITSAPMPVHTAAWAIDIVVCTDCVEALQPSDDEEIRCDRCHRSAPAIYTGFAACGPVLMAYGLCATCTIATRIPTPNTFTN